MFQCSQSSRGWWNRGVLIRVLPSLSGFSALSRAVVGGTLEHGVIVQPGERFSALSRAVVGGTGQSAIQHYRTLAFQCSQSSRGWWNAAGLMVALFVIACFSALSRAVVGGTY